MSKLYSPAFEIALRREIRSAKRPPLRDILGKTIPFGLVGLLATLSIGITVGLWITKSGSGWNAAVVWFGLTGFASTFFLVYRIQSEGNQFNLRMTQQALPISDEAIFRHAWRDIQKSWPLFSTIVLMAGLVVAFHGHSPIPGIPVAIGIAAFAHFLRNAMALGLWRLPDRFPLFRMVRFRALPIAILSVTASAYFFLGASEFLVKGNSFPTDSVFWTTGLGFVTFFYAFPIGMGVCSVQNFLAGNYGVAVLAALVPTALVGSYPLLFKKVAGNFSYAPPDPTINIREETSQPVPTAPDVVEYAILGGDFLKPAPVEQEGSLDRRVNRWLSHEERTALDGILGMNPTGKTRIWKTSSLFFLAASMLVSVAPTCFKFFDRWKTDQFQGFLLMIFMMASFLGVAFTGFMFILSALNYRSIPGYHGLKKNDPNPYILYPIDWSHLIRAQRKIGLASLAAHLPIWLLGFGLAGTGLGSTQRGFEIGIGWFLTVAFMIPLFSLELIKASRLETPLGNIKPCFLVAYFVLFVLPLFVTLIILPPFRTPVPETLRFRSARIGEINHLPKFWGRLGSYGPALWLRPQP